jgi:DNA-binding response OmpR family regulator
MAKILLVEDEESVCILVSDVLSAASHLVEFVHDGASGRQLLEMSRFDMAILDWNLPDMTGIDLCRLIRGKKTTMPVLFLTGRREVIEREEGLDSGADDYLIKPFHPRELLARTRALLRRSGASTEDVLRIRDIVLYPDRHKAFRGDAEIELRPSEFIVLEQLMRNPNSFFSSQALLRLVRKSDSESESTVRHIIQRLREVLDRETEESLIRTVRGEGYRINF